MPKLNSSPSSTWLSIQDAASTLGISTKTLRRWEDSGVLVPQRTTGGHRRYMLSEIKWVKKHGAKKQSISPSKKIVTPAISLPYPVVNKPEVQPTYYEPVYYSEPQIAAVEPSLPAAVLTEPSSKPEIDNYRINYKAGLRKIFQPLILSILVLPLIVFGVISAKNMLPSSILAQKLSYAVNSLKNRKPSKIEAVQTPKKAQVLAAETTLENLTFRVTIPSEFSDEVKINSDVVTDQTSINLFNNNATTLNIGGASTVVNIGASTGNTNINNNLIVDGDVAVNGNTITSLADLVIDPGGGGVAIGTSTPGNIDQTGDDFFVSGDLEVDGISYIPTLNINNDSLTDITGTGLQISSSSLEVILGTSIQTGEIEDSAITTAKINADAVTTAKIADDTILEVDLKISNTATNGFMLIYDSSTGGFTWSDPTAAAGAWTDGGTNVYLTTTTDSVTIGGTTELAKFAIDGDTDEIQFLIQGNSSQTANLFVAENSSGTDLFTIGASGVATIVPSANSDALTITGTSITSANLLDLDARNTSGTLINLAYGSSTTLSGALIGQSIDFNSGNVTATNEDVTGINIKLPTTTDTDTSGSNTLTGLIVNFGAGAGINQNGAGGTLNYIAGDFRMPALTQTAGTLNAYGVEVTTPSSITTGGTAYGLYVNPTGVGAGTLYGLNIGTITAGGGTEYAINVDSGWDAVLRVGSTTVINGSGVTQVPGGGTGAATFTTNGVLYGNATSAIGVTSAGTTGQVLIGNTGSAPTWGSISGSACTTCVVTDPSGDQVIAPTGQGTTGLIVRQTSTASPTDDIFQITNSSGSTKYFYVDVDGNVSTGAISNTTLTLTPTTNTTALTLVGTNVTTAKNQYINTSNDSGTITDISYGSANTLTGTLIGANIDLSTNVTATNQSATGQVITLPQATNTHTSGTVSYTGISISDGGGLNQNGAGGTTTFTGSSITIPALTQTAGTIIGYGTDITLPSSITTGGTAYGVNINASGISAGTITGVNIGTISSPGAGTEYGLVIGSGWDRNIYLNDTTTSVLLADGGSITITDGTNTLCTITDSGSAGDLSCTGSITGGSTGTQGFWARSGTNLSPATAGDDVLLPDSDTITFGTGSDASITYDGTNLVIDPDLVGTGTVRIAGTEGADKLTVTAGDANISDGSLTITDDDNAASLSLTNNTADTVGASAATGLIDLASTSLTTGTLLNLELTEATLNGGFYIKAWDATAGATVFSVGEDGATNTGNLTLAANASFTMTSGTGAFLQTFSGTTSDISNFDLTGSASSGTQELSNYVITNNVSGTTTFFLGHDIEYSNNSSIVHEDFAMRILFESSTGSDNVNALLNLESVDANQTADGILIESTTANMIVDAIDASDAEITNAINVGTNFILGDGIRQFSSSSTVWTVEDTGGNDLITITDAGTTGNMAITGDLAVNGNTTIGNANTDTLTINAGTSGTGITFGDSSFANCTITTVSGALTCGTAAITSFTAAGDSGGGQAITNGNTLSILGGTNGIDTVDSTTDTVTINFDSTEVGTTTWNAGATDPTWTFNTSGATDPTLAFANSSLTIGSAATIATDQTSLTLFNTTATTINFAAAATTALNIGNGSGNYTAINLGSGSGTHTINIAGTGATAADTINIGTGGTAADTINIGNSASSTAITSTTGTGSQTFASSVVTGTTTTSAFVFTGNSLTSGTGAYVNSNSITQGNLMQVSTTTGADTLTSGNLLRVSSDLANSTFTGNIALVDWSPDGTTEIFNTTANLLQVNLGQYGNVANLLNISDNSSSIFTVAESTITSAIPHAFTAAGDVSMAYDLQFTNQTASYIKSNSALTILSGESFESNNLNLAVYNAGSVVVDGSTDVNTSTNGVLLVQINSATSNNVGLRVSHTMNDGTTAAGDLFGAKIELNQNDVDGDYFGLQITNNATTAAVGTSDVECLLCIDNAENTANVLTDFIRITNTSNSAHTAGTAGNGINFDDTDIGYDIVLQNDETIDNESDGTVDIGGELVIELDGGATTTEGLCGNQADGDAADTSNVRISDCSGTPSSDYMELYPMEENIEIGDLVAPTNILITTKRGTQVAKLSKSQTSYQQSIIGIASNPDDAGDFNSIGYSINDEDNPKPVALSGRVPLKISQLSEPISQGDYLTSSDEPGKAMKATHAGPVFAKALEDWTPESGKATILVFVDNSYWSGNALAENNVATDSASLLDRVALLESELALLQNTSTSSANLTDLTLNKLTVLEDAILPDTMINGKLNVGTLTFDNTNNSIDAIGVLKIQSLSLDNIEFLGGLITFDTNGNIKTKEITAQKYNVSGASAGTSTLPSGETEILVESSLVSNNSLIFVTPKAALAYPMAVVEKQEGIGFKVKVAQSETENIEFDWFIVDHENEN